MKGDFSRNTFDRQHHFSRVLMQQGRVLLDADWNEQTSILLHYLRTLAADLIGPHGGPGDGFKITCDDNDDAFVCDFIIGWGHYYVDGILCENTPPLQCPPGEEVPPLTYNNQPNYPLANDDEAKLKNDTSYLVYLDVWERHLTHLEADNVREVALGGPDTATRARIVWQVKVAEEPKNTSDEATCADLLRELVEDRRRCLRARARVEAPSDDPCIIPPEARYRGAENQLYRVEIHDEGTAGAAKDAATFKWSSDNGSIVFGIRSLQGSTVVLDSLGPDNRRSLKEGDWVEIIDDVSVLRLAPRPLLRVEAVDRVDFEVTLSVPEDAELPVFDENSTTHPLLRRWDQDSDVLAVQESKWIDLKDGVQVYFESGGTYRTGDYWLIPARTATGDVLWPTVQDPDGNHVSQALPPHGIEHHYAPLARISVDGNSNVECVGDECRCTFAPPCATGAPTSGEDDDNASISQLAPIPFEAEMFFNEEIANDNAEQIHEWLDADPRHRVSVVGYAAPDEAEELSVERAETVLDLYTTTPASARKMKAYGAGVDETSEQPLRVDTYVVKLASDAVREQQLATLKRIENIGNRRAADLLAVGRTTPNAVASMSVIALRSLFGVSSNDAREIKESARSIAEENT